MKLWCWLSDALNCNVDFSSLKSIFSIFEKGWSPQLEIIIPTAMVNIIWVVLFCRNKLKFDSTLVSSWAAINLVKTSLSLPGRWTKMHMHCSIQDLAILRHF